MWVWVIIIAVVIGGLIGYFSQDNDALSGAAAGGCLAGSCLLRIAMAAIGILVILWLFGLLFG